MIAAGILGIQLTLIGIASFQLFEITNGAPAFFYAGILCLGAGVGCTIVGMAAEE